MKMTTLSRRHWRELVRAHLERWDPIHSRWLQEHPRQTEILNEVVLNQVLLRVVPVGGDAGAATRDALRRVQEERVCWLGGSQWHGIDAMRISVSNWSTTEEDVDRSADSIIRAVRAIDR